MILVKVTCRLLGVILEESTPEDLQVMMLLVCVFFYLEVEILYPFTYKLLDLGFYYLKRITWSEIKPKLYFNATNI